jgi:histidinol phosphatase-like enzyme
MTSSMSSAKAAMLDRDGTIIPDRTYTNDPKDVTLIPGAADAIRLLAAHGYPSVVITNQSGIARGLVSLSQYHAVRMRLAELLAAEGASLLDTFSCPHHLSRCLFIGDKARDLAPAVTFKARAALVHSTNTANVDVSFADSIAAPAFPTLLEAVTRLLEPRSWSS